MEAEQTKSVSGEMVYVVAGQVWRDKRESWRTVEITDVFDRPIYDRRGEQVGVDRYVSVRRNTSRRKQAIKVDTLYAKYRRDRL